jgi:hypothetical protein
MLTELERSSGVASASLHEAPGLGTPVALTRRRILLPAHAPALMDDGELEAALAHELGHLRRRDPQWLVALRIVEALFFFQPLNRFARRRFQDASEFLADAWAVKHTGHPLDLARSLAKVSSWSQPAHPTALVSTMARRESPVVERVRTLLGAQPSVAPRAGALSALVLLPAFLLPPVDVPPTTRIQVVVIREVRSAPAGTEPGEGMALREGRPVEVDAGDRAVPSEGVQP